jgi:hypothetical protein
MEQQTTYDLSGLTEEQLGMFEILQEKKAKGQFVTVTFRKIGTGEERKINGLLRPISKIKGTGTAKTSRKVYNIYGIKEKGWRSFRISQIINVK